MKPETRIALVKIAEKSKRIQTEEYSGQWVRLGYVGATVFSLLGLYFISVAIAAISRVVDLLSGQCTFWYRWHLRSRPGIL